MKKLFFLFFACVLSLNAFGNAGLQDVNGSYTTIFGANGSGHLSTTVVGNALRSGSTVYYNGSISLNMSVSYSQNAVGGDMWTDVSTNGFSTFLIDYYNAHGSASHSFPGVGVPGGNFTLYARVRYGVLGINPVDTASASWSFVVDNLGPTIAGTVASYSYATLTGSGFGLSDSGVGPDSSSWKYWFDSSAAPPSPSTLSVSSGNISISVSSLAEGAHTLYVRAADNLGNLTTKSFSFSIDRTGPTISGAVLANVNATLTGSGFALTDAASGPNATSWKYWFDSATPSSPVSLAVTSGNITVSVSSLTAGAHNLYVQGADSLGNLSQRAFPFTIDRTGPTIAGSVSGFANATLTGSGFSLTDTASGPNVSSWKYWFDSATPTNPSTLVVTGEAIAVAVPGSMPEGSHLLYVQGADNLGNLSQKSFPFVVDRTGPSIIGNISSPVSSSLTGTGFALNDGASGGNLASAKYWFDSSTPPGSPSSLTVAGGAFSISVAVLNEGSHSLYIQGADNVGNLSQTSFVFSIDRTGPTILGTVASYGGSTLSGSNFSIVDAAGPVNQASQQYWYDSASPPASPLSFSIDSNAHVQFVVPAELPEGTHSVYVQAADNLGNATQRNFSFVVDRVPPTISGTMENFASTVLRGSDFSVLDGGAITTVDSSSYRYWFDSVSAPPTPLSFSIDNTGILQIPIPANLETGPHSIYLRVSDKAGNLTQVAFPFIEDRSGPTIGATVPGFVRDVLVVTDIVIADADKGVNSASYQYGVDGQPPVSFSLPAPSGLTIDVSTLPQGAHTLHIRGSDLLGNVTVADFSVTVDRTPPAIAGTLASNFAKEELTLNGFSVIDAAAGVAPSTLTYRFDNQPSQPVPSVGGNLVVALPPDLSDGVHTLWIHAEDILGNAQEVSFNVHVDKTPPSIGATVPAYVDAALTVTGLTFTDDGSGVDASKDAFWFDNQPSAFFNPVSGIWSFDVASLTEGPHTLSISSSDKLGNQQTVVFPFVVDRALPVVGSVRVFTNLGELGPTDIASSTSVSVLVEAHDSVIGASSGAVTRVVLKRSSTPLSPANIAAPDGSWMDLSLGDSTALTLTNGLNYLYVLAQDGAGHWSSVFLKQIEVNNGVPSSNSFAILGLTHPVATSAQEAAPFSDAIFEFHARSGAPIKEFVWELKKGSDTVTSGTVTWDGTGRVSFSGLGDNLAGEFYTLSVWAVANNLQKSAEASIYRFRVDTTPPQSLSIRSNTHPSPSFYYPSAQPQITWDEPRDMTGVKAMFYRIVEVSSPLPVSDLSDWTSVSGDHLNPILNDDGSLHGIRYVQLCAEDFSGNREFVQREFRFDVGKPVLNDLAGMPGEKIQISQTSTTLNGFTSASVSWGVAQDDLTLDSVIVDLSKWDGARFVKAQTSRVFGLESNSTDYSGIEAKARYLVNVKVKDGSGNERSWQKQFCLEPNPDEPAVLPMPFSVSWQGYRVEGIKDVATSSVSAGSVTLPEQVDLRDQTGTLVRSLSLRGDSFLFDDSGEFVSAVVDSATGPWTLSFSGFTGKSSDLTISFSQGLTASRWNTSYAGLNWDFPELSLTFPPVIQARSSGSFLTPPDSAWASPGPYSLTDISGWRFVGVETARLSGGSLNLTSGAIDGQSLPPRFSLSTLRSGVSSSLIPIQSATLSVARTLSIGLPVTSLQDYLEFQGNRFQLLSYQWKGSKLVVYDANLLLEQGQGYSTSRVEVKNFSVDLSGNVVKEAGFSAEPLSFTSGGLSYTFSNWNFDAAGNLLVDGVLQSGQTTTAFRGLHLEGSGPNFDLPASVDAMSFSVGGYLIVADAVQLGPNGVLNLIRAHLQDFPQVFGGGSKNLTGLSVQAGTLLIVTPGVCSDAFSFDSADYKGSLSITSLRLDANGLFAQGNAVLPPSWSGTAPFVDVPFNADGTMGTGGSVDVQESWNSNGFTATPKGVVFAEKEIRVAQLRVTGVVGLQPGTLDFADLRLNGAGVTKASAVDAVSYTTGNWVYSFNPLLLDDKGLHGNGVVTLPQDFGSREISFPDFAIVAGGFHAGTAAGPVYADVKGWKTELRNIALTSEGLFAGEARVALYPAMANDEFVVANLQLNLDGTIAASGTGTRPVSFRATNGFVFDATSYRFTNDALVMGGKVHLPDGLGGATATLEEGAAVLSADGSILSSPQNRDIAYHFGALEVQGKNFWIDRNGIYFESSVVTLSSLNLSLTLPKMGFYADGSILFADRNFPGFETDLFGCHFAITNVSLVETGLAVSAFITLPQELNGVTVYFDPLIFHPDGTITSETAIPEISFTLETIQFNLKNLRFAGDGFTVGSAVITLPSELENKQIRIGNLKIGTDGSFQLGSFSIDPLQLFGFTFYLDDLSFQNKVLGFKGRVQLPDNLGPGISGQVVSIKDFRVSTTSGELLGFDLSLDGEFSFPLQDKWTVTVQGIGVQKDAATGHFLIVLNQGTLSFPPDLLPDGASIGSVSISGLKIDPVSGTLSFDQIALNQFRFSAWGVAFAVDQASINGSFDFSLSGSVTVPNDEKLPALIRGKVLTLTQFQILHDGTIGNIQATLSGLDGPLFDSMTLSGGMISLSKTDTVRLGVAGHILLGGSFPDGVRGKSLDINAFEIDLTTGEVTKIDAGISGLDFMAFNAFHVTQAGFAVAKTESGFDVSVAGTIILPGNLPGVLANQKLTLRSFRMASDGTVKDFGASLSLSGSNDLFNGVKLKDALITADLLHPTPSTTDFQFGVSGQLLLGSQFPQGLAGAVCSLQEFTFTTSGTIKAFSAQVNLADFTLLNVLPVKQAVLTFKKLDFVNDLSIGVSGKVYLPSTFPQGLAGLQVNINQFTITTSGTIQALDIGASGINLTILNALKLENGAISVRNQGNSEFVFSTSGTLVMPSTLPQGLANARLNLGLHVSTLSGLQDFTASLGSTLQFDVFAGIKAKVTALTLNTTGFSVGGALVFPSDFPIDLQSVVLQNLAIKWDGTLVDIQAGIGQATVKLGGFSAQITNLLFHPDGITLGSCVVTLPSPLNAYPFGIKDAGIKYDGTFYGTALLPSITADIAGFQVYFNDPAIDPAHKAVTFSKVGLKLPPMLKNVEANLSGVTISPAGLAFNGGSIRLPDFTAGPGLGFRNMSANFMLSNGQYRIDATGQAMIPGAGTFSAEVSFVNVSSIYPIGLKNVLMTYRISGLGLPLGSTGLYLNEITGGLAFGPPDELPAEVRWLFTNGTRVRLGVGMVDQTGGSVINAHVNMWIDVTNVGFVFKGDVLILNGMANAEVIAAITGKGFYGKVRVQILFVRGQVEIWVYGENGKTLVAGSGLLQFCLPRGILVDTDIDFLFIHTHISIPDSDWWGPTIGAAFGHFKNGRDGVKGWIDFSPFGQLGIFVPNGGGFEFINIGDYTLATPDTGRAARTLSSGSGRAIAGDQLKASSGGQTFTFDSNEVLRKKGYAVPPATRSNARAAASTFEQTAAPGIERLVFVMGVAQGDPQMVAISPSGVVFTKDSPNVEVTYPSYGQIFVVKNPEPGNWQVQVNNAISPDSYKVFVMGVIAAPQIQVDTPTQAKETTGTSYIVQGKTQQAAGDTVSVYLTEERESYVGPLVGQTTVAADGSFQVSLDSTGLKPGEYFVFAGVAGPDGVEKRAYAAGSLIVPQGIASLKAPQNLTTALADQGAFELWFKDPNGDVVKGFKLRVEDQTRGTMEDLDLGYLNYIRLDGYDSNDQLTLTLRAYDQLGNEGPSAQTSVKLAAPAVSPGFDWKDSSLNVSTEVGSSWSGNLVLLPTNSSANNAVKFAVVSKADGLNVSLPPQALGIPSSGLAVPVVIAPLSGLGSGTYPVTISAVSTADPSIVKTFAFSVTVAYPAVKITGASPTQWNAAETPEISLYGQNFFSGTRVLIGGIEVPLNVRQDALVQFTAPAGLSGSTIVKVIGPGGQSAQTTVNVVAPYYIVYGLLTEIQGAAGDAVGLSFRVDGVNAFHGLANFHLENVPAFWSVQLAKTALAASEEGRVTALIPSGTSPGRYAFDLVSDRGDRLPLVVNVSATPTPAISNLSQGSAWPGESLVLYGSRFGSATGSVTLGALSLPITSWTANRIVVTLPTNSVSGTLALNIAGRVISGPQFYIKTLGFNLYSEMKTLKLEPGEETTLPIRILGFSPDVALTASEGTGTLQLSLDSNHVVPNATALLTVKLPVSATEPVYSIGVTGTSGSVSSYANIRVEVANAFRIATSQIPEAMVNAAYLVRFAATGATGNVRWSLRSGDLPLGLRLTPDGSLNGMPLEEGIKTFEVEADDASGRQTTSKFILSVTLNVWNRSGMDNGQSRFNATGSPADSRKLWSVSTLQSAHTIWTGKQRVFALGDSGLSAFDDRSGAVVYQIAGNFLKGHWERDSLYLLSADHVLSVYDGLYGGLKWSRESVTGYFSGSQGLIAMGDSPVVLDPATGALIGTVSADFSPGATYLEAGSETYRYDVAGLGKLTGSSWQNLLPGHVSTAAADVLGVLALVDGKLVSIDLGGERKEVAEGLVGTPSLALSPKWIVVSTAKGTEVRDRQTLDLLYTWKSGGRVVLAQGKAFVLSESSLDVFNLWSGKSIWSADPMTDGVLAGTIYYALGINGRLNAYSGPDNVSPPVTELKASPSLPNGSNEWYVTVPQVKLVPQDRDGRVVSTLSKVGTADWKDNGTSLVLPEGTTALSWYSTDDGGWQEKIQQKTFNIDTVPPIATWSLQGTSGKNSWYTSPVTLTGASTDTGSGMSTRTVTINGASSPYNAPIVLSQGSWKTLYSATDVAGNKTEVARELKIDLTDPIVTARVDQVPGLAGVILSAIPGGSDIYQVRYRLDGGAWQIYQGSPAPVGEGKHHFEYLAESVSGRVSETKSLDLDIASLDSLTWILNLEIDHWKPGRGVERHVVGGEQLFAPDNHDKTNRLPVLPPELKGSDYIVLHVTDRLEDQDRFLTFQAGIDLEVFVARDAKARQALPEGFVKVPGLTVAGRTVWKKNLPLGATLELNGPDVRGNGGPDMIFAQKASSQGVRIAKPEEAQVFHPWDPIDLEALTGAGNLSQATWRIKWDNSNWQPAGRGWKASVEAPFVEDKQQGIVELNATVQGRAIVATRPIQVSNLSRLKIVVPQDDDNWGHWMWNLQMYGWGSDGKLSAGSQPSWNWNDDSRRWDRFDEQEGHAPPVRHGFWGDRDRGFDHRRIPEDGIVLGGGQWDPMPKAWGVDGVPIASPQIAWSWSQDGKQWTPMPLTSGRFTVPVKKGYWILRGDLSLGHGQVRRIVWHLEAVSALDRIDIKSTDDHGSFWWKSQDSYLVQGGVGTYRLVVNGTKNIEIDGKTVELKKIGNSWTTSIQVQNAVRLRPIGPWTNLSLELQGDDRR